MLLVFFQRVSKSLIVSQSPFYKPNRANHFFLNPSTGNLTEIYPYLDTSLDFLFGKKVLWRLPLPWEPIREPCAMIEPLPMREGNPSLHENPSPWEKNNFAPIPSTLIGVWRRKKAPWNPRKGKCLLKTYCEMLDLSTPLFIEIIENYCCIYIISKKMGCSKSVL